MSLTDADIVAIRDNLLPSQGERFDCIAFARALEERLNDSQCELRQDNAMLRDVLARLRRACLAAGMADCEELRHATFVLSQDTGPIGRMRAALDVLLERHRQIDVEGWTPEHDDEHDGGEMAWAAACYITATPEGFSDYLQWPWSAEWWKPRDRRRNLVRAGALLLAEIERLDRIAQTPGQQA